MLDLVAELISEMIGSFERRDTDEWGSRHAEANRFRRALCGVRLAVSRLRIWLSTWCSGSTHCDRGAL